MSPDRNVLTTPDGRYIIVRGRLWRRVNPALSESERTRLMAARRAVAASRRAHDEAGLADARAAVHRSKLALGERGPVWWTDGARDYTRFLAKNTPYAEWYERMGE